MPWKDGIYYAGPAHGKKGSSAGRHQWFDADSLEDARAKAAQLRGEGYRSVKVVRPPGSPSWWVRALRRNPSDLQRQQAKAKAAAGMLKAMNPAQKVRAVRVKRLKGGGVSIMPVKVKALRRGR